MASQNTLKLRNMFPTVKLSVSLPKDQQQCPKRMVEKPAHKVGRVVHTGGTKVGSFERK